MTAQEFFNKYSQAFVEASETNKLFPSVIAAQAALETGYGKSIKGNNMFGIKAIGKHTPFWKGDKELVATHEVVDGSSIPVDDYFRAYASASDSIRDHSYFLSVEPRYKENGVFEASSPEEQVYALMVAGYATDPAYGNKLLSIIDKYDLRKLDKKKS